MPTPSSPAPHRHQQHQADGKAGRNRGDLVVDEQRRHPGSQERPDHEHVAVGEVQQLENAVDQRVAEGNQRVKAPEFQPVHELLQEDAHGNQKGDGIVPSPFFLTP